MSSSRSAKTARPLSERERRFVEAYMGEAAGNATKAALIAGYSHRSARSMASRLLTKRNNVRAAIAARAKTDALVASRETRQRFWTSVLHGKGKFAKVPWRDRLKASELLGKSQGDFIERHEHTGKDGGPLRVTFGGRYKPEAQT